MGKVDRDAEDLVELIRACNNEGPLTLGIKNSIALIIPIEPRPARRPRARAIIGRDGQAKAMAYKDTKARVEEEDLFWALKTHPERPKTPLKGPLKVIIQAHLPHPKTGKRRLFHVTKPDLDNLEKFALDALTRAGYLEDDKWVVEQSSKKFYAYSPEEVGWRIWINEIEGVTEVDRPKRH
jgi:Holliday junction resolvase RusA-like endonuclease